MVSRPSPPTCAGLPNEWAAEPVSPPRVRTDDEDVERRSGDCLLTGATAHRFDLREHPPDLAVLARSQPGRDDDQDRGHDESGLPPTARPPVMPYAMPCAGTRPAPGRRLPRGGAGNGAQAVP